MSKKYEVRILFGKTWAIIDSFDRQTDALHYVKEHPSSYPTRIVRVTRDTVFESK